LESDITLAADWLKVNGEGTYFQTGLEIAMATLSFMRVAFRGGYMFNRDADKFTLGLGAEQSGWQLDYAYGGISSLSPTHQVTATYRFGGSKPKEQSDGVNLPDASFEVLPQ
jgi:hypothetical protein